jgi:uncharacterized protein (DUF58 family)
MPGDDIRRIDWRLFARTDRHYIKLFEADTNANFVVLLDVSASMSYGSTRSRSWTTRATWRRASYFSSEQRDRVGLVTFDHEIVEYVPPSMKPPRHDAAPARPRRGRTGGLAHRAAPPGTELLGARGSSS